VADEPLDDPIAEKLRRQRLEEEADFRAARDLFGGGGKGLDDLLPKTLKDFEQYAEQLSGRWVAARGWGGGVCWDGALGGGECLRLLWTEAGCWSSRRGGEQRRDGVRHRRLTDQPDTHLWRARIVNRYVLPHAASKNYKGLLKAILRVVMEPLSVDDAKEVEQAVAGGWAAASVWGQPGWARARCAVLSCSALALTAAVLSKESGAFDGARSRVPPTSAHLYHIPRSVHRGARGEGQGGTGGCGQQEE